MIEHIEHISLFASLIGFLAITKSLVPRVLVRFGNKSLIEESKSTETVSLELDNDNDHGTDAVQNSRQFKKFEKTYLLVYLLVMLADWMQGPYVYQLYASYGYEKAEIALLFIVGFGSSMVTGTFVGAIADRSGRRFVCQCFCVIYAVGCFTKHSSLLTWLFLGRFLSGVATSILHTCFESWLVQQHHQEGYPARLLSSIFSKAMFYNGIVAIGAGVIANYAYDIGGAVGPFDVSAALLLLALVIISIKWPENYGDSRIELSQSLTNAFSRMWSDRRIFFLGMAQSLFEGAMFIFVFMWTPALEEAALNENIAFSGDVPHGWVFACFMAATMIGSQIFSELIKANQSVEHFLSYVFMVACGSLLVPVFVESYALRILSFLVFEVCCGLFWPSIGTLRGRIVPDEVRTTVMNLFRVPLNMFVVVTLLYMDTLAMHQVWTICSGFLLLASLIQSTVLSRA